MTTPARLRDKARQVDLSRVPVSTKWQTISCGSTCPGGNPCCLQGDRPHGYCICHDSACVCHAQERYHA